jgi:hypothetical protein
VALVAAPLAGELVVAPAASASSRGSLVPLGLFGLPSLHSIIQAIAKGFFGALAGALVPSWLKHGTVATIQHLVALPDIATWTHVSQLQGEMTYLGAMLLPVTLAVGATRYWLVGLTGAAHPASALSRCIGVTGVLVAYRWIVEQAVAGTNTLSHGILALPAVANGLQRIIGVLFGGALLSGAGGVFGAFLVIIGVVVAAGLFAAQVLLTVVLAVLIVAGPPVIALSAIPELSHLARSWAHALLSVALVPLGWTVLFATAGALCLDAASFTGAGGGLPGHVAAAFAGLITFVIAGRLPLMAVGEIRHLFSAHAASGRGTSQGASAMAGTERVRAAHARLRAVGLEGVPSFGRSVGRAAGALGVPHGGLVGASSRGLVGAARRTGLFRAAAEGSGGAAAGLTAAAAARNGGAPGGRGVKARLARARSILTSAPAEAMTAVNLASRGAGSRQARTAGARDTPAAAADARRSVVNGRATPRTGAPGATAGVPPRGTASRRPDAAASARAPASRPSGRRPVSPVSATAPDLGRSTDVSRSAGGPGTPRPPRPPEMHPAGKRAHSSSQSDATSPQPSPTRSSSRENPRSASQNPPPPGRRAPSQAPRSQPPATPPRPAPPAPGSSPQGRSGAPKRRPRPRSRP